MERGGHLRRRAHPHDGRSSLASLFPVGKELTEACFPHFQGAILPLLERLGPERDRILSAMEELSAALDAVIADLADTEADTEGALGS